MEATEREWTGSPLEIGQSLDPYGIREVALEFDNGDSEIFKARISEEFGSYELHQMAAYLESIAHSIRKGQKR